MRRHDDCDHEERESDCVPCALKKAEDAVIMLGLSAMARRIERVNALAQLSYYPDHNEEDPLVDFIKSVKDGEWRRYYKP